MKQSGRVEFACILILSSAATLLGLPGKRNQAISSTCEYPGLVLPTAHPRQRLERVRLPRSREAQLPTAKDETSIPVHLQDYVGLANKQYKIAKQTARHIFRHAGVEIIWLDFSPGMAARPKHPSYGDALGPGRSVLRIFPESMARCINRSPKVLGSAHLTAAGGHGVVANIFFDRVQELADDMASAISGGARISGGPRCARLLGSVMAHELAHLFGNGHSPWGIMNHPWSSAQVHKALEATLDFSSVEGERIREQVKERFYPAGDGE